MAVRFDADGEDYSANLAVNTTNFTVACWVRIDVDRNTFSTAWNVDDGGTTTLLLLQTNADGVTWNVADETTGNNLFAATVGVWYFIAIAKGPAGASNLIAYWAAANDAALTSSTLTRGSDFTTATSRIGESVFTAEWLNGSIAALKCWGAKLTQSEIENERFQMLPHRTSNLTWFYPFLEGGTGAGAVQDFSGNGNNLTGGSGSATTDGPPIPWRQCTRQAGFPPEEVETVKGTDILDFGAFPGKSDASVVVTGQTAIISGSLVEAWIRPADTADHTADEHMVESIKVFAGNIVAGTGFTIYGFNTSEIFEPTPNRNEAFRDSQREPINDRLGTRIYGQWTVAWAWA